MMRRLVPPSRRCVANHESGPPSQEVCPWNWSALAESLGIS